MSSQADKFKIGLFVVLAFFLGIGLLIWLGAARYFEQTRTVAAYFNESVQGLATDSPVKFRGVTVGRIKSIRMAPDDNHVEVLMSLKENFSVTDNLGVKITLLGLTGQKYLEMDRVKPKEMRPPMELSFKPKYPVITTYPSDMREIGNALDNLMRKFNAVDIDGISNRFLRVATKLDKMLDNPKVVNIGAEATDAIREIKLVARKLNRGIDEVQVSRRVKVILDKTAGLVDAASKTVHSADKMIRRTDNNLNRLSRSLDNSADNIEVFTDRLRREPWSTIFRGAGKEEKKK